MTRCPYGLELSIEILTTAPTVDEIKEAFLKHVVFDDKRGCWIWHSFNRHGTWVRPSPTNYGWFTVPNGRNLIASRAAYALFKGPVPAKILVCHTCDDRGCVNPDHLYLGTYKDNSRDRHARTGRSRNW